MLSSRSLRLFANPRVARALPYRDEGRDEILCLAAFSEAKREITSWPGYTSDAAAAAHEARGGNRHR